jgi:hypothetical protein
VNEWEYSVELGHRHGVKVYPSLEVSRLGGTHHVGKSTPARLMRQSLRGYAARAANVLNAGADGIHTFNLSWKKPSDKKFQVLASLNTLRDVDKLYFANYLARESRADFYLPSGEEYIAIERLSPDDPRELSHGKSEMAQLYFGENLDWLQQDAPEIAVHLQVEGINKPTDIEVKLNGKPLDNGAFEGNALRNSLVPSMVHECKSEIERLSSILKERLRYSIKPFMLHNGLNRFEIRCARKAERFILNDLFVSVTHRRD